ncbi:hypothetical protein Roomu2_00113 [Pseudomonas phage vB_PpuM-Roomu-2]|uniref:Uncharacterized protein n=2 Tax=Tartuvirus TaxID=3424912 RepID=A0AAX4MYL4_9CAUD
MIDKEELLLILANKQAHRQTMAIASVESFAMSGRVLFVTYAVNHVQNVKIQTQWNWDNDKGWQLYLYNGECLESLKERQKIFA